MDYFGVSSPSVQRRLNLIGSDNIITTNKELEDIRDIISAQNENICKTENCYHQLFNDKLPYCDKNIICLKENITYLLNK